MTPKSIGRIPAALSLERRKTCRVGIHDCDNSPFCGKIVHKSMIERLRKDPQNPTKFVKICDKCNTAYLERQMLMPFWKQYQKIKIVVDDREKKYETLTVKVNKVEAEVVNITRLVRTSVN